MIYGMLKRFIKYLLFFLLALALSGSLVAQNLYELLKVLPGVTDVQKMETNANFKEAYIIMFTQPVDHHNPAGPKFQQRIFLSHDGYDKPTVMVTEGYNADYAANPRYSEELARLFDANQIVVEHRYFGKSVPNPKDWKYMTVEEAAADHHAVVELFKKLYTGKWITTGISKGGQTSIYHHYFYPNDMDATVAYVAPINFAQEDPREDTFLQKVGDKSCRARIFAFQQNVFKNKSKLLPLMIKDSEKKNLHFTRLSPDKAFNYMVLEYPFSFWQWGSDCDKIPAKNISPEKLYDYFSNIVQPYYYSDEGMTAFEPFFYQANTELGYYGYDEKPFRKWLKNDDYPNTIFAPQGVTTVYHPESMRKVDEWLQNKATNLICIYGGNDPWEASAARIDKNANTLKMIGKGGSHATRIATLTKEQQEQIYSTLEKWLDVKVKHPK